jgi:hypothetical protein
VGACNQAGACLARAQLRLTAIDTRSAGSGPRVLKATAAAVSWPRQAQQGVAQPTLAAAVVVAGEAAGAGVVAGAGVSEGAAWVGGVAALGGVLALAAASSLAVVAWVACGRSRVRCQQLLLLKLMQTLPGLWQCVWVVGPGLQFSSQALASAAALAWADEVIWAAVEEEAAAASGAAAAAAAAA